MSRIVLPELPAEWTSVPIGRIVEIVYGESLRAEERAVGGNIPVYGSSGIVGHHDEALHNGPSIVIGRKGTVGAIHYVSGPFWCIDTAFYINNVNPCIDVEYLAYILNHINLSRMTIVVGVPGISRKDIERVGIPLPPLSEQRRIVSILHEANDLKRLRGNALDKSQSLFLSIFVEMFGGPEKWHKTVPLDQLVKFVGGGTPDRKIERYYRGTIPWATSKDIKSPYLDDTQEHITEEAVKKSATNLVPARTILMVVKSKILTHSLPVSIITRPFCFGQDLKGLVCNSDVVPEFITASLLIQARSILNRARGVNTEGLTLETLRQIQVPDVTTEQQVFLERVKEFNALTDEQEESRKKADELIKSVYTQAFTGELTAEWRELNAKTLAIEVAEVDHTLNLLKRPKAIGESFTEIITSAEIGRDLVESLSSKQRRVFDLACSMEKYFTAEQLNNYFENDEWLSLPDMEQTLYLLAEAGLLMRVRAAVTPTQGQFIFSSAYRHIRSGDESRLADLSMLEAANK
jgi:type I restriction enzyme, S subunit